MSSLRGTYTVEYKQEAVRLVTQQGLSAAEVASRLGIRSDLVRRWKKEFARRGDSASPRQPTAIEAENRQLREEVRRLTMEREILKKRRPSSRRSHDEIPVH